MSMSRGPAPDGLQGGEGAMGRGYIVACLAYTLCALTHIFRELPEISGVPVRNCTFPRQRIPTSAPVAATSHAAPAFVAVRAMRRAAARLLVRLLRLLLF